MPRRREQPPRRPPDQPPSQPEFVPSPWPLVRFLSETDGADREGGTEARETTPTVFEQFISSLKQQLVKETHTTMAGTGMTWKEFPVEEALSDGLWVIFLKAAERNKHALGTEDDVRACARIIDHFFGVGVSLNQQTPETAAADFIKQVIPAVEAEMAKKSVGQGIVAADAWRMPVAQFFAPFIKRVQDAGMEMERNSVEMQQRNTVDEARGITFVLLGGEFHMRGSAYDLASAWGREFKSAEEYADDYRGVSNQKLALETLKAMPYKTAGIPLDVHTLNTTIEEQWLKTQLILAGAGLPDRDYLKHEELPPGITAVQKLPPEEVFDRFCARMKQRNPKFEPTAGTRLLVHDTLGYIANTRIESESDFPFLGYYVQVDLAKLKLTRELASKITASRADDLGSDEQILREIIRKKSRTERDAFENEACAVIDWATMTPKEVERMCAVGLIPLTKIVDGVRLIADKENRSLAANVILKSKPPQSIVRGLQELGLVENRSIIITEADASSFPDEKMEGEIKRLLYATVARHEEKDLTGSMRTLLRRAPRGIVERLFANPESRKRLAGAFYEVILPIEGIPDQKEIEAIVDLKRNLGDELFFRWLLAQETVHREDIFVRGVEEKEKLKPWKDLAKKSVTGAFIKLAGIPVSQLTKALETQDELEVFRWINEQDPHVEARVREYEAGRARYFAKKKSKK